MDGKEKVLKQFDFYSESKPHWKIYYGLEALQGNLAASTEVFPGTLDKTLSRKRLTETLDLLPAGDYLIQFKDAPNSSKNIINNRFELGYSRDNNTQQPNTQLPGLKGYIDPETHQKLVQAAVEKKEAEWQQRKLLEQVQDVRREMKELREGGGGDRLGRFTTDAKEILAMVKGMIQSDQEQPAAKPAMMHGPKEDADENARKMYFKKLYDQAISELFESEQGSEPGILLLWCLNEWRKANPEQYKLMKPEILKLAVKLNNETGADSNPE